MLHKLSNVTIKSSTPRKKVNIITIDPPNAKDLDDGLGITDITRDSFAINISIADVAAHVKKNSHLDNDAYRKGFTRYGKNGATDPMFPRHLSEGVLSLLHRQTRLTKTVKITISGNHISEPTILNTESFNQFRFTYEQADRVLSGKNIENPDGVDFVPIFEKLKYSANLFLEERQKRGSNVFYEINDFSTYKNEDGILIQTPIHQRSLSHIIVAECMIKANTVFAHFMKSQQPYGFFRVTGNEPNQSVTQNEDELGAGGAYYSPDPKPHSNIGTWYAHGTSPIRRYADLIAQRLIDDELSYNKKELIAAAKHLNAIEKTLICDELLNE